MKHFLAAFFVLSACPFLGEARGEEALEVPEGRITSPYDACKGVVIISEEKYQENKKKWDELQGKCKFTLQKAVDTGFTKANPLKEGAEYLVIANKVAEKVLENLKKSRTYADCSIDCFSGTKTKCTEGEGEGAKVIQCQDRIDEVLKGLIAKSRSLRQELALGTQSTKLNDDKKIRPEDMVNKSLIMFEHSTPNPAGNSSRFKKKETSLSPAELKKAADALVAERAELEKKFVELKKTDKTLDRKEWIFQQVMKKRKEHRDRYRTILYEEAPLLAVIGEPTSYKDGHEPMWSYKQIANGFRELLTNAETMTTITRDTIKNGSLEFSRTDGTAFTHWLASIGPKEKTAGAKIKHDLLYYMTMKNQVESVLKDDPSLCAGATSMAARIGDKELQNMASTVGAAIVASAVAAPVATIVGPLTAAEASGAIGFAMGASFLGDSFNTLDRVSTEMASMSGFEGATPLRKSEEVKTAQEGVQLSTAFFPLDVFGAGGATKAIYKSIQNKIVKEMPEVAELAKKAQRSPAAQDQLVSRYLLQKMKDMVKSQFLSPEEVKALEKKGAGKILESLISDISKSNPDFFNNPENLNFLFKTAAASLAKQAGDPSDLAEKATQVLLSFSKESIDGSWDPAAQDGLLKVFNATLDELRLASHNDLPNYLKVGSSEDSRKAILKRALKRAGVSDEKEADAMVACLNPRL